MSTAVDGAAQINHPRSNPYEQSKRLWIMISSLLASIGTRFHAFIGRIKIWSSEVKNFILRIGNRPDFSTSATNQRKGDNVIEWGCLDHDDFVKYMRDRWQPTRDGLGAMIESGKTTGVDGDGRTRLFTIDFLGGDNNTSVCGTLETVNCWLKAISDDIDCRLHPGVMVKPGEEPPKLEPLSEKARMNLHRSMQSMETIATLFKLVINARKTGEPGRALYYEMLFLAELLSVLLHVPRSRVSAAPIDEKEELLEKPGGRGLVDALNEIAGGIASIDDNGKLEIERGLEHSMMDKCKDLFELFDMFANDRLSLIKNDNSGNENVVKKDDRFQRSFVNMYPEWRILNRRKFGSHLLFVRLLANTGCLALENTEDMNICKHYCHRLDKAKRLFYQDKSEGEALEMAKKIVDDLFAIELSVDDLGRVQ